MNEYVEQTHAERVPPHPRGLTHPRAAPAVAKSLTRTTDSPVLTQFRFWNPTIDVHKFHNERETKDSIVPLLSEEELDFEKPSGFWPAVCSRRDRENLRERVREP